MFPAGSFVQRDVVPVLLVSVLVSVSLGSPVPEPEPGSPPGLIRCAPCSPERLLQCPAVPPGCPEPRRLPGCGCCMACALRAGQPCGIHTAPCGSGLRCTPRPGDPRPLLALTRGHALCTEVPEPETRLEPEPEPRTTGDQGDLQAGNSAVLPDPGSSLPESSLPGSSLPGSSLPGSSLPADTQDSMKDTLVAIRKTLVDQGPCHLELQTALEKIAVSQQKLGDKLTTFYLPNCDKYGFYKPKQCESSLDRRAGRCWCVNSWNGKRTLGTAELPADAECP